jgi:hypothetical protein
MQWFTIYSTQTEAWRKHQNPVRLQHTAFRNTVNCSTQPYQTPLILASALELKTLRSALFCKITQHTVVIVYRSFGTAYGSHLHGCPETPVNNYLYMHHISQNSADLIHFASEAWNHQTLLVLVTSMDTTEIHLFKTSTDSHHTVSLLPKAWVTFFWQQKRAPCLLFPQSKRRRELAEEALTIST